MAGIFPTIIGGGSTHATPTITPGLTSDLFNAIDTGAQDFGQANAQNALATGDTQEAGAYQNATDIANANARLAEASGQVEQAQTGIEIRKTLGSQEAAVAGGGFGQAGSAVALLRSSTRQGLLQQQIVGMNAQMEAGGYLEQGAAATAEAQAASAAGSSATALAQSEAAMAQQAKTNAINEASILGLKVPGLGGLSATNIPSVNPTTLTGGGGFYTGGNRGGSQAV